MGNKAPGDGALLLLTLAAESDAARSQTQLQTHRPPPGCAPRDVLGKAEGLRTEAHGTSGQTAPHLAAQLGAAQAPGSRSEGGAEIPA